MSAFNTDALKGLIKWKKPNGKIVGLSLRDYLDQKARCGCGMDCCDNTLHMIDVCTGVHYVLYICNGEQVFETHAEYLAGGGCVCDTPSGETGETGATGETGETGETGGTGRTGATGE